MCISDETAKEIVKVLTDSEDDEGYDWDTVDAKHLVNVFVALAESGTPEDIADFINDAEASLKKV